MALEVIHRFDIAREMSTLSLGEEILRCKLKKRILGLADIEHARRKRVVRLNMIKFGDATTRFFHRRIISRRRKNFIQCLEDTNGNGWKTHEDKAAKVQSYFKKLLCCPLAPKIDFN
jgi:hypothetical protein